MPKSSNSKKKERKKCTYSSCSTNKYGYRMVHRHTYDAHKKNRNQNKSANKQMIPGNIFN